MMQFTLAEGQPCMNPTYFPVLNSTSSKPQYELEIPMSTGCKNDKSSGKVVDARYKKLSLFSITEEQLFQQNGVLQDLRSLSGYP